MTIDDYRIALAEANRHGWGFLAAYGTTWLVCGVVWSRASPRVGAFFTLFQGLAALPVALLLTALTPGPATPTMPGLDTLVILLASGQLLGLPIVIYLTMAKRYTMVPLAMALLVAVHFAPYSWLYATPLYLVMGGLVSVGAAVAQSVGDRPDRGDDAARGPMLLCFVVGGVMALSAAVAVVL
ncbi:MAG: hypothetical protein Q4P15_12680 [Propionibacteriaceae bacterium]|nr:hypothetical protein [Propionibacteriaceae bacterium]